MTTVGAGIPPELERDRLRSLKQLELIDTPREERFERLTRMARHVFGVPMSSVSLIDQDRQWFKSIQGLPLSEVPRERTVCQTTIARSYDHAEDPALVLEDAAGDPDFAWIPGIGGDGGIRFYAGYPLYGPGGHPVGTFCLYDTVPRTLDADQVAAFSELAAMVQRELQWADDLERAAAIQRQLLPRPLSGIDGVDVAAVCIPAFVVGGDFYDHYPIRGGLVVTVADVMGKGMGAAIVAAGVRSAFRGASRLFGRIESDGSVALDAGTATTAAAEHLSEDLEDTGTFATAFHAVLDCETGTVTYVDAGHGLSMVRRSDGTVEALGTVGLPLGVVQGDSWAADRIVLEDGDMLVVCSDGLLDLLDGGSDCRAVHRFVADKPNATAVVEAVRAVTADAPPLDDVTVVAIRRGGRR